MAAYLVFWLINFYYLYSIHQSQKKIDKSLEDLQATENSLAKIDVSNKES